MFRRIRFILCSFIYHIVYLQREIVNSLLIGKVDNSPETDQVEKMTEDDVARINIFLRAKAYSSGG